MIRFTPFTAPRGERRRDTWWKSACYDNENSLSMKSGTMGLLMPVFVPTAFLSFGQGLLIPVLPLYAKEMGGSFGLAGLIVSAAWIGTMIFDLPSGLLLPKFGFRRSMIAGAGSLLGRDRLSRTRPFDACTHHAAIRRRHRNGVLEPLTPRLHRHLHPETRHAVAPSPSLAASTGWAPSPARSLVGSSPSITAWPTPSSSPELPPRSRS